MASVQPVAAQTALPAEPLHVAAQNGGTLIEWNGENAAVAGASVASVESVRSLLPAQRYQGYDLPMQVIALRAPGPDSAQVQIVSLQSVDLPEGAVQPGVPEVPPVLLEQGQELPTPASLTELPTAPAFLLRAGQVDGYTLVVVGLSPIYRENGVLKLATRLTAFVPGAVEIDGPAWQLNPLDVPEAGSGDPTAAQVDASQGTISDSITAVEAVTTTITISVTQPGIQRLRRATLAEISPEWSSASFNLARITHRAGANAPEVVLPVQRGGSTDLYFYVDKVGDRWNSASHYLLSLEDSIAKASPNMDARSVAGGSAGSPSVVLDIGEVRLGSQDFYTDRDDQNRIICRLTANAQIVNCPFYNSNTPGSDGDHYFVANLVRRVDHSTAISKTNTLTLPVTIAEAQPANLLPLAGGSSLYTVVFSPDGAEKEPQPKYDLRVGLIGATTTYLDATVQNPEYLTAVNPLQGSVTAAGPVQTVTVTVKKQAWKSTMLVEAIAYQRRVSLDLNQRGALVTGLPGAVNYRWASPPAGVTLYDVTDPADPVVLSGQNAAGFEDSLPARRYLVGGPGFVTQLPRESLALHQPLNFNALPPSDAIYIIPNAEYKAALQPLLTHRATQSCPYPAAKCKVLTVEAGQIYDRYSGGHVSPEAIRAFLHQAFFDDRWRATVLDSVVFVGDGTYDPKNLEKKGKNFNLIPPYLHEKIDPWIGETACDRCYGQLDGVDPHTGDELAGRIFFAEIWTGRFPVNSPQDLAAVVSKILAYEKTTPANRIVRSRVLYLADNYRKAIRNGRVVFDAAGDFVLQAETARSFNPLAANSYLAPRIYYDPLPAFEVYDPDGGEDVPLARPSDYPWHFPSAAAANSLVRNTISAGVAMVVYNGHANNFQQGRTEEAVPNDALVQMNDSFGIANASPTFVQLSMTCLSSQFIKPTDSGTVLDEAYFVREDKGSIAAWGPAGLSVVHGHDALQKGFFESLFQGPRNQYMGRLMEDGYLEVMLSTTNAEDVLRTFVFFGDPLTRIRYTSGAGLMLPIVEDGP